MSTTPEDHSSTVDEKPTYRLIEGKERYLQTTKAFLECNKCDFGSILMALSIVWTFFRLFAPGESARSYL